MEGLKVCQIHGEPSIVLGNEKCRATVTIRGGHLRMEFKTDQYRNWQSPYSYPPWKPSHFPDIPPVLQILRGDFFCFPFGLTKDSNYPHGETANRTWEFDSVGDNTVVLKLSLTEMPGSVTKQIRFDKENCVLYQEHIIEGVNGTYNYGHHPTLEVPEGQTGHYSCSPFRYGQVYPHGFTEADQGEVALLESGSRFNSLEKVRAESGRCINIQNYPYEEKAEDLLMLCSSEPCFAWNAFSVPGFLWISIRKTNDFPSTLLWLSNGGRPQAPWNSKHKGRIGIEDVCSYFHEGAHRSRLNLLKVENIPTARTFNPNESTSLRHIQLVIPGMYNQQLVRDIEFNKSNNRILIHFENSHYLKHPVELSFFDK